MQRSYTHGHNATRMAFHISVHCICYTSPSENMYQDRGSYNSRIVDSVFAPY